MISIPRQSVSRGSWEVVPVFLAIRPFLYWVWILPNLVFSIIYVEGLSDSRVWILCLKAVTTLNGGKFLNSVK